MRVRLVKGKVKPVLERVMEGSVSKESKSVIRNCIIL